MSHNAQTVGTGTDECDCPKYPACPHDLRGHEGEAGPSGVTEEEAELQDALNRNPKVRWEIRPKRNVYEHKADIMPLLGSMKGDTLIVCGCAWAMRIPEDMLLREAEELFMGHASE